jgi:3-keto-disaccharide hydrolase
MSLFQRPRGVFLLAAGIGIGALILRAEDKQYWTTGVIWPEPKVVDPGPPGGPPSDAIVLFDGKGLSAWKNAKKWTIRDGYAESNGNDITTKQAFGDCQLHVEWEVPAEVQGDGQGRGNSGVYLMGLYEVQILESYQNKNKTYHDGQAGALYKQRPPLVSACRKPGEWQSYDIIFTAPRFDANGKLRSPAFMTVLQNGVLIQNHFPLLGHTNYFEPPNYKNHATKLPIVIQYHSEPIRFRNIWIRELEDDQSDRLNDYREKLGLDNNSH